MTYRNDKNLEFLGELKSEDLNDLVHCLIYDKDGETRWTEELTASESYKKYCPNHAKYWKEIATELQRFGANTFATVFRGGKGVEYKEILVDVCKKMKVSFDKDSSVIKIENRLFMKILSDALEKMSPEQLKELAQAVGVENMSGASLTPSVMIGLFQAAFRAGGFKSYQLTVIIVNAVMKSLIGRGVSFAGGAALTKSMAILTGPIGWVFSGVWALTDVAGAAYRVTIPAVIQIAALRQKYLFDIENQEEFGKHNKFQQPISELGTSEVTSKSGKDLLQEELKKLKGSTINGYISAKDIYFNSKSFDIDSLIMVPGFGLVVVELRSTSGDFYCTNDNKWNQKKKNGIERTTKNVSIQSLTTMRHIKKLLDAKGINKWPMKSLAIFTHPDAKLFQGKGVNKPQTEILKLSMLENWIEKLPKNEKVNFTTQDFKSLYNAIKSEEKAYEAA